DPPDPGPGRGRPPAASPRHPHHRRGGPAGRLRLFARVARADRRQPVPAHLGAGRGRDGRGREGVRGQAAADLGADHPGRPEGTGGRDGGTRSVGPQARVDHARTGPGAAPRPDL
ncbi:MAG: Transcriptional regulator, MarR family, partial [uncultured Corynebacteriales bacterium]